MCHIVDELVHSLSLSKNDSHRALEFQKLQLRLLELFDDGFKEELKQNGQIFYATEKMFAYENGADINMSLGNKEDCLACLQNFFELSDAVSAVVKSDNFHLSARSLYFSETKDEDITEEYMSEVFPERVLKKA